VDEDELLEVGVIIFGGVNSKSDLSMCFLVAGMGVTGATVVTTVVETR